MKSILICILCSFSVSAVLSAALLPLLKRLKAGQYILGYVKEHKSKGGTPTMGGLAFIASIIIVSIIFCGLDEPTANLTFMVTSAFAIVGFLDDFLKIYRKDNQGLKPYQKIVFQTAIAAIAAVYCYVGGATFLNIPFCDISIEISWGIIPFAVLVFLATVNCVNLTDGLDGLAGGTSAGYLLFLGILLYCSELEYSYLCFAAVGALSAFLLFNVNKASVFMGDTGSLALGGLIASLSLFSGNGLYVPVLGITFVISGISVIVQVIYYKRTKKRVFLMAPFHHHLQMKGYSECKISYWYFAVTCFVGIICLIFSAG